MQAINKKLAVHILDHGSIHLGIGSYHPFSRNKNSFYLFCCLPYNMLRVLGIMLNLQSTLSLYTHLLLYQRSSNKSITSLLGFSLP